MLFRKNTIDTFTHCFIFMLVFQWGHQEVSASELDESFVTVPFEQSTSDCPGQTPNFVSCSGLFANAAEYRVRTTIRTFGDRTFSFESFPGDGHARLEVRIHPNASNDIPGEGVLALQIDQFSGQVELYNHENFLILRIPGRQDEVDLRLIAPKYYTILHRPAARQSEAQRFRRPADAFPLPREERSQSSTSRRTLQAIANTIGKDFERWQADSAQQHATILEIASDALIESEKHDSRLLVDGVQHRISRQLAADLAQQYSDVLETISSTEMIDIDDLGDEQRPEHETFRLFPSNVERTIRTDNNRSGGGHINRLLGQESDNTTASPQGSSEADEIYNLSYIYPTSGTYMIGTLQIRAAGHRALQIRNHGMDVDSDARLTTTSGEGVREEHLHFSEISPTTIRGNNGLEIKYFRLLPGNDTGVQEEGYFIQTNRSGDGIWPNAQQIAYLISPKNWLSETSRDTPDVAVLRALPPSSINNPTISDEGSN